MKPLRLMTIAGASICGALAAGALFAPQTGQQSPADISAAGLQAELSPMARAPVETVEEVEMAAGTAVSLPTETEPKPTDDASSQVATAGFGGLSGVTAGISPEEAAARDCAPRLTLATLPQAMIAVDYQAPCLAEGASVTLAHGPLALTGTLDAEGRLALELPALAPEASVSITALAPGTDTPDIARDITVADFAAQARLVLEWHGPAELGLSAFEAGADWGGEGHIHAASAPSSAGFVTALGGADAARALILTYPAGVDPHDGRISVEAELALNSASCGRSFTARVLLVQSDAPVSGLSLDLDTPACGIPDGYIFLGDILPEAFRPDIPPTPSEPGSVGDDLDLARLRGPMPELAPERLSAALPEQLAASHRRELP